MTSFSLGRQCFSSSSGESGVAQQASPPDLGPKSSFPVCTLVISLVKSSAYGRCFSVRSFCLIASVLYSYTSIRSESANPLIRCSLSLSSKTAKKYCLMFSRLSVAIPLKSYLPLLFTYVTRASTIMTKAKNAPVKNIGCISFSINICGSSNSTAFIARLPSGWPYSLQFLNLDSQVKVSYAWTRLCHLR